MRKQIVPEPRNGTDRAVISQISGDHMDMTFGRIATRNDLCPIGLSYREPVELHSQQRLPELVSM
jgi:hypothetical protein